jgi:putative heme-binding domain-containing protein
VLAAVTSGDPEVEAAGMELGASWIVGEVRKRALETAPDAASRQPLRPHAIRALGALGGPEAETILKDITLRPEDPQNITALQALLRISREAGVAAAGGILSRCENVPLIRGVFTVVAESDGALDQLAGHLDTEEMSEAHGGHLREAWIAAGVVHGKLDALLDRVAGLKPAGLEYGEPLIGELVVAAKKGDVAKGEAAFKSATLGCFGCHTVGGQGGSIGPDLSAVGSGVPPERIVTEVLWPGKQVKEGFSLTRLTLKNNRVLQGYLQKNRDEGRILLRDFATGRMHEIPAADRAEPLTRRTGGSPELFDRIARPTLKNPPDFLHS